MKAFPEDPFAPQGREVLQKLEVSALAPTRSRTIFNGNQVTDAGANWQNLLFHPARDRIFSLRGFGLIQSLIRESQVQMGLSQIGSSLIARL